MQKQGNQWQPTILCIDDEPVGLMVRAKLLEMSGFSVITGVDGPSAMDLYRKNDVDLVLLDYMMPHMHGGEVARELRSIDPRTPIIILSAYLTLPEDVTAFADLCLVKGLPPPDLVAAIWRLLENRQAEVAS